jgi:S1-C subfamily serine protease/regulation of enolase protein 1 (concanavalin A-like superfamily)
MLRCWRLVLACLFLPSPVLAAEDGIPARKLQELKAATVYIKAEGKDEGSTGSGFLIRAEGQTALVVTNQHVIGGMPGQFTPDKISVVVWSGTKKERTFPARVIAADSARDLAVLEVTGKDLPAPLDLTAKAKLRETMTVYTLGFPLGDLLSTTKRDPAVTIGKGTVSSLREDDRGRITRVQLDAELNPGNSGGPVVDSEGKLVGIAVAKVGGTKIGFAIPPDELNEILQGNVSALIIRSIRVEKGTAQLEIEVPFIDPLRKIKSIAVRHVSRSALKKAPLADKEGVWPELYGSEKVLLKLERGKGVGTVKLERGEKKPIDWLFQATWSRGEGKWLTAAPLTRTINFAAEGVVRPGDPNAVPWETVTSKEGQFTVEMPAKPNRTLSRTRKGPGGTVRVLMMSCQTKTGSYVAARVDFPRAVRRGAEDLYLDDQRDDMAEHWNGKVIREKRVRAEGRPGRDYTIRGRPDGTPGVLTVRVRQYLVGRTIFVVAVASMPNRELPLDTGRFLGSLALGEERVRAAGTPGPEPLGKNLPDWGLAIDPDKDCTLTPTPKTLAVKVPGTWHDLNPDTGKLNSPRVVRSVEGDFVATVMVTGDFQPGGKSTNPRGIPYNGAGLLVWSDSDNFIRLERGAILRAGRRGSYVAFEEREGGYRGAVHNEVFTAGACYLRLERKGSRILGAVSTDGMRWKQLQPIDTVWPAKLKVGLAAINSSSEPFSMKFEEFTLDTKAGKPRDQGR